jgi:hypothetical protein
VLGGVYSAWASQGASGLEEHFSMVHVAPAWHPILQPPVGQLRMMQVAPAAHWIWQDLAAQVSITQVDPAEQCWMEHPTWQLPIVQLAPGPHSRMKHPPEVHAPNRQTALAPLHVRPQPPPQLSISQWAPALQLLIMHPPLVHVPMRQVVLSPLHSSVQAPAQPSIVQLALLHGIEQLPVSEQSTLQVAPGLQVVWQLPPGPLQSTLQVVLAAHSVLQPPPGQPTAQGCDREPQVKSQVPGFHRSVVGVQEQLGPLQEHWAPGDFGFPAQVTPSPVPPPPCPPCEVVPPRPVLVEVPPWPPKEVVPPRPVLVEVPVAPPIAPAAPPAAIAPPVAPAEPSLATEVAPPVPCATVVLASIDEATPPLPRLPPRAPIASTLPPVPPGDFVFWLLPQPNTRDATSVPHIARTVKSARIVFLRCLQPSRLTDLVSTSLPHELRTEPAYAQRLHTRQQNQWAMCPQAQVRWC